MPLTQNDADDWHTIRKKKSPGHAHSIFTLQINSNKAHKDRNTYNASRRKHKAFFEKYFSDDGLKDHILLNTKPPYGTDVIHEIKTDIVAEIGSGKHRLHYHIKIYVKHDGTFQIHKGDIDKLYYDYFGVRGYVSRIKGIWDSSKAMDEYFAMGGSK